MKNEIIYRHTTSIHDVLYSHERTQDNECVVAGGVGRRVKKSQSEAERNGLVPPEGRFVLVLVVVIIQQNEKLATHTLCVSLFFSYFIARDFTPLSTGSSGSFYREDTLYIYTSKRFRHIAKN